MKRKAELSKAQPPRSGGNAKKNKKYKTPSENIKNG